MRRYSIKFVRLWFLVYIVGCAGFAVAQNGPKPISWLDVPAWRSLAPNGAVMSPDGQWVAYGIVSVEGDGELYLQKTGDTTLHKFPVGGSNFLSMVFSEDGKWFAFKETPKNKDEKATAKSGGKTLYDKLYVLELATQKKMMYDRVNNYAFNGTDATHLGMVMAREKGSSGKGGDFLLLELTSGKTQNIGNVSEFEFNKKGNWLAYTIDAGNQAGNGLHLMQIADKKVVIIQSDKATYRSLNWNEEGTAFALLKMVKDEKYKQEAGKVIGVKDISINPTIVVYDPLEDSLSFPKEMTISPNKSPLWTEDLTRLLFGIHEWELAKKEPAAKASAEVENKDSVKMDEAEKLAKIKADTAIKNLADLQKAIAKIESGSKAKGAEKMDTVKPDMTIWHWKDKRLQARQQVLQNQDKNFYYWGMYDTRNKQYLTLNKEEVRSLSPLAKHQYALATDNSLYELDQNLNGQNYQDFYLVDLNTGKSTLLFENFYLPSFASYPRASPDGKKLIYGKDGHYYVYDIAAKTHANITEAVPASFVNTEDDHNVLKPLTAMIDWSADSKYILIRDLWDIWQVPVATKEKSVNITQNGRAAGIRYQYRVSLDPEEKGIDLTQPMYVRMYGERNKKSGIGLIDASSKGLKAGVQVLLWEDGNIARMSKAKNATAFTFSKESFTTPTEYFFTKDTKLIGAKQVTKNAPDLEKYQWSKGVRLVNYVSDKGDSLQGALFLPAGYVSGNKYPTMVYYYEKLSQTLHNWSNPGFSGTGWNTGMYTSNGYAVFIPDIVYKLDDPGMSAVWSVLPAINEAIKTGVIDAEKIGIHGHSWGGYQTAFLVTQTNMFKAAAAGAPLTNLVSMYDLIYWNSGNGNMSIFEASQGRFKGAPWENWDAYLRNSPVYHVKKVNTPLLMLHNDKDGAVDFTQGIEYYSALRRLKKPVVLIQYKGENHGLGKMENRKDYAVRMMEFFDAHLKGKEAPDWWSKGISLLDLDEHLDSRGY